MTVLAFRDVHRRYRPGEDVLAGVGFALEAGEVVGLLGKNGSGKTTVMHLAMGMIRAQQGTVRIFGLDPREKGVEVKRRVGFVSENRILPPAMRVGDVLRFHRGLFASWDADLEDQLRARFGFDDRARVQSLSKGEARQLALLCAVAHRPELLLLDEPAGGLDPAARREFLETAIQLLSESGTSILFSSHHMADVERMAGRVVLLAGHRVLVDADLDDLRENHLLAVVPAMTNDRLAAIQALPECLRVRRHRQTHHVVFRANRAAAESRLGEVGIRDATCRHVSLEDLFVELVGAEA
jgi:ABC-2 type transport system ATP-binding protein